MAMIFLLTGCLLTDAGEIIITCENAGSCDSSSDVEPPNYTGGYNTKRCEEGPTATGYAVGDVVPDLVLRDHYNEALQLSDFCANTVALVACTLWSSCAEETLEEWYSRYRDEGLTVITMMSENAERDTPTATELQEWASANGITHPVVADPNRQILSDFQAASEGAGDSISLPNLQLLTPGMAVALSNNDLQDFSEAELVEYLD